MAADPSVDESQFRGIFKYFNGTTNTGRANVAKLTYASIGLVILYLSLKPKKK
uniref:Unkown protein n=1 Tax=Riptortus pedestris TaxID=329032 RepID=R4WNE2_RIPPE|nr:unkown protein [Riptortus pedestris]